MTESVEDAALIEAMAASIARQRRADDQNYGLPLPPGDDGRYLPMDRRAAVAVLSTLRARGRLT